MNKSPQEIVNELSDLGETDASIASATGCDRSTINRIRSGDVKNPRWNVLQPLLALYTEKTLNQPISKSANDDPEADQPAA